jgi:hypothetical protein
MNVTTKNWGPEFKNLSNLIGLKSKALQDTNQKLEDEVLRHDGSHAYGRHGAQTGWESQFIRAVTKVTPDQAFDPRGLNPTIRSWNSSSTYNDLGQSVVMDLFGDDQGHIPTAYRTSAGNIAGGFVTPEAQFLARARGENILNKLVGPGFYAASYMFKTGPKIMRTAFNAVKIVVGGNREGGLYGIGFARRDPKNYPTHTREFAVRCIEGFQKREKWNEIIPVISTSTFKFNFVALNKSKVAFPQVSDLYEFFDLDVLWQPSCTLIYRRDHVSVAHTHGPWRLITMFPDSLEAGWAPSLFLAPAMKLALAAAGMNKNGKDYHWTGLMSSHAGNLKHKEPIPAWAGGDDD